MTDEAQRFLGLPRNADGHFRLLAYAAVFRIIDHLRRHAKSDGASMSSQLKPFPFLGAYFEELRTCLRPELGWSESRDWLQQQTEAWEQSCPSRLPLRELNQHAGLSHDDQIALVMIGLVEEDIRFGSLFALLQEPLPPRRPCLGLLAAIVSRAGPAAASGNTWNIGDRLLSAGLVVAENQSDPHAEWILRVKPALWKGIRGRPVQFAGRDLRFNSRRDFPSLKRLVIDDSFRPNLAALPGVLARGQVDAVILRGMDGSGRHTIMGSLARAMRRDMLYYDLKVAGAAREELWSLIGPLCAISNAFPVIAIDPHPGETVELQPLTGYRGPIGIVMRREGGVAGAAIERAVTLTVPSPTADQRLAVWKQALNGQSDPCLEEIVDRRLLPLGNVHRAAAIAAGYASLNRRSTVTESDVQLACRSLNRQVLDTLAQRLEIVGGWSDLVTNELVAADLRDLERRCRHRERLLAHMGTGFRNSANSGVRALFNGPSGTGKTLAARILGSSLSMDLYRVDLASIINKYVGETEKNLSQLLARAEELDVLLLIDEGDALMGSRTEVKSSNDRYANMETNYLLQRLETYQGIVVVTTNSGNRIDSAFKRRFDTVISFSPPDQLERLLIWQLHLPAAHQVSDAYLHEIAQRCSLNGGQIRNAAAHAALLSVDSGREGRVYDADLEVAIQLEFRKQGASCPLNGTTKQKGHQAALTRFLAEVG